MTIALMSYNGPVVNDGYEDQAAEMLNGHRPVGPLRGNKYSAFEGGTHVVEEAADHTLSLRTHEWKYIQPSDTPVPLMKAENIETGYLPTPQLYTIGNDIHEDENVATSYPNTLFKLQSLLRQIVKASEHPY